MHSSMAFSRKTSIRPNLLGLFIPLILIGYTKLHRALYGLKQAPKAWFECLHLLLHQLGFHFLKQIVLSLYPYLCGWCSHHKKFSYSSIAFCLLTTSLIYLERSCQPIFLPWILATFNMPSLLIQRSYLLLTRFLNSCSTPWNPIGKTWSTPFIT